MTPHKTSKKRQYSGKLVRKDTGEVVQYHKPRFKIFHIFFFCQIVPSYPIIWFEEDGAGGWTRLETKLSLANLNFLGSLIPTTASAIPGSMQDLADSCKTLGIFQACD